MKDLPRSAPPSAAPPPARCAADGSEATAPRRAEESQARTSTFAEATFEGIVESEAGRIVDCNEQLARMLGYSIEELKGMETVTLIAPEDRQRVMANIMHCRESVVEHCMLRKDGTRLVVEAHGRPVSPTNARRHTAIRDITARKQVEEQMRQAKEDWEQTFNTVPDHLGLLQLNDRRKGRFTAEGVALWERLAGYLAVALAKTQADSLGLRLVQMLAGQLHATVDVSSKEGTEFAVTFDGPKTIENGRS